MSWVGRKLAATKCAAGTHRVMADRLGAGGNPVHREFNIGMATPLGACATAESAQKRADLLDQHRNVDRKVVHTTG